MIDSLLNQQGKIKDILKQMEGRNANQIHTLGTSEKHSSCEEEFMYDLLHIGSSLADTIGREGELE